MLYLILLIVPVGIGAFLVRAAVRAWRGERRWAAAAFVCAALTAPVAAAYLEVVGAFAAERPIVDRWIAPRLAREEREANILNARRAVIMAPLLADTVRGRGCHEAVTVSFACPAPPGRGQVIWTIDSTHPRNPAEDSSLLRGGVMLAPRSEAVFADAPDSAVARVGATWLPRFYRPEVLALLDGHFERFTRGGDQNDFPGGCGACRIVRYRLDSRRTLVLALSARRFGGSLYTFVDSL
jgi:hypothetical protein